MKALNSNLSKANQSNQLQPVLKSKKINIFEKMEKRYGFKIDCSVMICEDKQYGENGFPDGLTYKYGMIPPSVAISRVKGRYTVENSCISSLDELYKVTKTGFYSKKHPINKEIKKGEPFTSLIPVILISYKRTTCSFRVDNNYIRDFFLNTESMNKGKASKEKLKLVERRFLEHMEFIQYFYAPSKSSLSPGLWLRIFQEKIQVGKSGLLHSEYLEWKSANMN